MQVLAPYLDSFRFEKCRGTLELGVYIELFLKLSSITDLICLQKAAWESSSKFFCHQMDSGQGLELGETMLNVEALLINSNKVDLLL